MIRKGQIATIPANDMGAQRTFIASQFAVAAFGLAARRLQLCNRTAFFI